MYQQFVRCEARNLVPGDVIHAFQDFNKPQTLAAVCQIYSNGNGTHNIIFLLDNKFVTQTWCDSTPFAKAEIEPPVMYANNHAEILSWLEAPA
jgi:hypothetical protein